MLYAKSDRAFSIITRAKEEINEQVFSCNTLSHYSLFAYAVVQMAQTLETKATLILLPTLDRCHWSISSMSLSLSLAVEQRKKETIRMMVMHNSETAHSTLRPISLWVTTSLPQLLRNRSNWLIAARCIPQRECWGDAFPRWSGCTRFRSGAWRPAGHRPGDQPVLSLISIKTLPFYPSFFRGCCFMRCERK